MTSRYGITYGITSNKFFLTQDRNGYQEVRDGEGYFSLAEAEQALEELESQSIDEDTQHLIRTLRDQAESARIAAALTALEADRANEPYPIAYHTLRARAKTLDEVILKIAKQDYDEDEPIPRDQYGHRWSEAKGGWEIIRIAGDSSHGHIVLADADQQKIRYFLKELNADDSV